MAKQKLTAADEKAIVRFGLDRFDRNDPNKTGWAQYNQLTGEKVEMNEFMSRLVELVFDLYRQYERGDRAVVKDFDRMKYIVLKLDSDVYYKLID